MLVNSNRFPVTDEGVVIPKGWFGDATEVEIRQEDGRFVIVPVDCSVKKIVEPYSPDDPIWKLGENPVELGVADASINHDKYIYGDPHGLNAQEEQDG